MSADGQHDEDEPRRLSGDAAFKAHLESVDKRNLAARKKAAEQRSMSERATIARARLLKGD
jgi:hypothetical protein